MTAARGARRFRNNRRGPAALSFTPTATFAMAQLAAPNRVYQRSASTGGGAGKGQGTVPVAISGASAGTIVARCRSAADGSIVQPEWQAATIAGAATTASITGVDARLGWFYLDLKGADGAWQNGTVPIGMGRLIGVAGQSLMVCMLARFVDSATSIAAAGAAINPNGRVLASNSGTTVASGWQQFQDVANGANIHNAAGGAELLDRQIQASGVNCGLIGNVAGGTAIATWQPGQANHTELARVLTLAGSAFEAFWWYQGHSDGGSSYSTYYTPLNTLLTDVVSRSSVAPKVYISCIPNVVGVGAGTTNAILQRNRAGAEWAAINNGVFIGMSDLTLTDGTHPDQLSGRRQAWHFTRATLPVLTGAANDDGPVVTRIVKTGVNLACTVAQTAGGTALLATGAPASRMMVLGTGDNSFTPLALDATTPITIDTPTQFTLKLAADPGDVALEFYPMSVHPVNDGYADRINDDALNGFPIGRQLKYATVPVLRKSNAGTLSGTGIAYAAGKFGNGRSAGEFKTAAKLLPSWPMDGAALECWVTMTTLPAATSMLCGQVGNMALYVTSTGAIIHSCGTNLRTTPTTPLAAGQTYHLRVEFSPLGFTRWLFVNGIMTDTIAGPMAIGTATPFAVGGNGAGGGIFITGVVDEVAWFNRQLTKGVNFAVPTVPYAGNESGLVHLWHLNGDGIDSGPVG